MKSSTKIVAGMDSTVLTVAAVWAVLIGGFMAGVAALLNVENQEVTLIGVLGGLGSAASVFVVAPKILAVEKSTESIDEHSNSDQ